MSFTSVVSQPGTNKLCASICMKYVSPFHSLDAMYLNYTPVAQHRHQQQRAQTQANKHVNEYKKLQMKQARATSEYFDVRKYTPRSAPHCWGEISPPLPYLPPEPPCPDS